MSDFDNGLTITGNVGVNITPSAWDPNVSAVQLKNSLGTGNLVLASASGNATNIGSNWYYNTAYKYSASGLYANNTQTNAGVVTWNIAPTGTAGNNITWLTQMTLDVSGNLGIGVVPKAWISPAKVIDAGTYAAFGQGRGGTSDLVLSWNGAVTSGTNSGTGYVYKATGDLASSYEQNGTHRWYVAPSGTAGNAISFAQAMTLDAAGNLSVGTSSFNGTSLGANFLGLSINGTSLVANGPNNLSIRTNVSGTVAAPTYASSTQAASYQQTIGSHSWYTAASGTAGAALTLNEVMRLDTAGNLGLGVTPSPWVTLKALQLGSSAYVAGSGSVLYQGSNNYYDGTTYKYIATAPATNFQHLGGQYVFNAAASGTAGTAISFTQVLLLSKGNATVLEGGTQSAGTGIAFPATQLASTNANTLDDYEEGTWIPSLSRDGTAPTGITYASQLGSYTKIGRLVEAQFSINISAISTQGTGNWLIQNLPFTSGGSGAVSSGSIGINGILSGICSSCYTNPGSSFIYPILNGQANSTSTAATGIMSGSITYFV